jgi:hypothetical protein
MDITIAKGPGSMNQLTRRIPDDTATSAHGLDCRMAGWSQRNERSFMMNHLGGWMGGGMGIYTIIGVLLLVLLVVVIIKMFNKKS